MKTKIFLTLFALIFFMAVFPLMAQRLEKAGDKVSSKASYYSNKFHGKKTASGELYHKFKSTAAHRTLPYGTMLRVTNMRNQKSVEVKVNDRGPFSKERELDISFAAASQIDMIPDGVGNVEIEVIAMPGETLPAKSDGEVVAKNDKGKSGIKEKDQPKEKDKPKEEKAATADKPKSGEKPDTKPEKILVKAGDGVEGGAGGGKKKKASPLKKGVPTEKFEPGWTYSIWGTQQKPEGYGVQIGAFAELKDALKLGKDAMAKGMDPVYIQAGWQRKEKVYRVIYDAKGKEKELESSMREAKANGFKGFTKKHFDD